MGMSSYLNVQTSKRLNKEIHKYVSIEEKKSQFSVELSLINVTCSSHTDKNPDHEASFPFFRCDHCSDNDNSEHQCQELAA